MCMWIIYLPARSMLLYLRIMYNIHIMYYVKYQNFCRSLSTIKRSLNSIGRSRFRPNPTVAVSPWTARWFGERCLYYVGRHQWWVQADRPRRGGAEMGRTEIETKHELWQAQQGTQVRIPWGAIRLIRCKKLYNIS